MFTLDLILSGEALKPSEYASFEEMADGLAKAFENAQMSLHPRVMPFLLVVMSSDLRGHRAWTWVGEDYEISVARSDS
jgi:hypothetical protein